MNKLKAFLVSIIIGLAVAGIVFAWTNPTGNPTYGGGALYYSGGKVGIGTTNPSEKLEVSGNLKVTGDITGQRIVQVVNYQTGAVTTGSTQMPSDDTIPQITEGNEYMTLAITPTSATNKLKIEVVAYLSESTGGNTIITAALFQDSTANALACGYSQNGSAYPDPPIVFTHYMTAGTTSSTTFRVRAGAAATVTFNGTGGARKYGGVLASSITITEIKN